MGNPSAGGVGGVAFDVEQLPTAWDRDVVDAEKPFNLVRGRSGRDLQVEAVDGRGNLLSAGLRAASLSAGERVVPVTAPNIRAGRF